MSTHSASAAVGEVLRQPDDLLKLSAYRAKLLKEKAALDAKLASGVKAQLDATRDALLKLQNARATVGMIREEMMLVEKLKSGEESGEAFDKITRVSCTREWLLRSDRVVAADVRPGRVQIGSSFMAPQNIRFPRRQ